MLTVIGVDPSISATGVALSDGSLITVGGKANRGDERLLDIACVMGTALTRADLVVMEDFVVRSPAAGILGMVSGVIRLMCLRASVPYALVSPATLKKYVTGSGNADKPDMRMALYQRTGLDVRDDNKVDAAWLRFAGLEHYGQSAVSVPKAQRDALAKVTWPDLPVAVAA